MAKIPEKPKKEPMSVRFLFIVSGVVWGLVLGPDIGLGVAKFLGALDWSGIAGTRKWPEWADWLIIGSGIITGLTTFFAALIIGRNAGDRFEYSHDQRLSSGAAIPWAVIAVGVTIGAISVQTIDTRKQAVVDQLQKEKDALAYLEVFAGNIQRFGSVSIDWPGNGEDGTIFLSIRGKHRGNYRLTWEIRDVSNPNMPLMEGGAGAILNPGKQSTNVLLSPRLLGEAWLKKIGGSVSSPRVEGNFTVTVRLTPELTSADWKHLPRHEPDNMADGSSILIDRVSIDFPVYFQRRSNQVIWLQQ
jgi:hypothetical protein